MMTSKLDIQLAWTSVKFAIDTAHRCILYQSRLTERSSPEMRVMFTQRAANACREMAARCDRLADLLGDVADVSPATCDTLQARIRVVNDAETVLFHSYNGCFARQTAVEYEALADAFDSLICPEQKSA